jgi:deazaflavin-dependent oxidoreductase (nitroreductase family)
MPKSQPSDPFETPERSTIRPTTHQHVAAMEASNDSAIWIAAGMKHLLLRSNGRRSGAVRKAALPFWEDDGGHPIVVASYAGAPDHPAWYLNLSDRRANPEVIVRIRGDAFWAEAQILDGAEYAETWEMLTRDRPYYRDYQALTERRIPLVRFVRKRAADPDER